MDPPGKKDRDAACRSEIPLYCSERVSSYNGAFRFLNKMPPEYSSFMLVALGGIMLFLSGEAACCRCQHYHPLVEETRSCPPERKNRPYKKRVSFRIARSMTGRSAGRDTGGALHRSKVPGRPGVKD